MKEGWLKILKLVTLEITIFRAKNRILSGRHKIDKDHLRKIARQCIYLLSYYNSFHREEPIKRLHLILYNPLLMSANGNTQYLPCVRSLIACS